MTARFPQPRDLRPRGVEAALEFAGQWAAAAAGLPGHPHAVHVITRKPSWGTLQFDHSTENQPIKIAGRKQALRVGFDGRLNLEFHGAKITSDAGLLVYRELDEALDADDVAGETDQDRRKGRAPCSAGDFPNGGGGGSA